MDPLAGMIRHLGVRKMPLKLQNQGNLQPNYHFFKVNRPDWPCSIAILNDQKVLKLFRLTLWFKMQPWKIMKGEIDDQPRHFGYRLVFSNNPLKDNGTLAESENTWLEWKQALSALMGHSPLSPVEWLPRFRSVECWKPHGVGHKQMAERNIPNLGWFCSYKWKVNESND